MFCLFLISLFFFSHPVNAANDFTTKETINFVVYPNLTASVNQQIDITNNYSQIYLKEYLIKLDGYNFEQIKASDSLGNIINKIDKKNNQTSIYLTFNEPVVGKDKINHFNLSYIIKDFAHIKGKTYEIQLPNYKSINLTHQTNLTLEIPSSFGPLSFSSLPGSIHNLNNSTQISYKSVESLGKPILLVFGNRQLFDFQLKYYLKNDNQIPVNTEIALPPDTNNQTVVYEKIFPQPIRVIVDNDGNWLAKYYLEANSNLYVEASGQVKIFPPIKTPEIINSDTYLKSQKYWPTDNPELIQISQSLSNPEDIYRYVVKTLTYNYDKIDTAKRMGAAAALTQPSDSLCTEFTDLFITLARIKGIPAREVEGFAFSNNSKIKPTNLNSDILHAWPQYYNSDLKTWVSIDPTWEKTTNGIDYFHDLDLNHFTFIFHGLESDYPPPPGSYKEKGTKTVTVEFANNEIPPEYKSPVLSLRQNQLIIQNPNPNSLKKIQITRHTWEKTLDLLPPYGQTTIDLPAVSYLSYLNPQNQKFKFLVKLSETGDITYTSLINRQYFLVVSIIIFILIGLLCLGGIILTINHKNEKNP